MEPENQDEGLGQVQDAVPQFSEMTEAEKEAEFRRQHQEYIAIKIARKKELRKIIKDQFESSSSSDDEEVGATSQPSASEKTISKEQVICINPTVKISQEASQKQASLIPIIIKKGNQCSKQSLTWKSNNTIIIQQYAYQIKNITKLKILADPIANYNSKIKITYHQSEIIFGVSNEHSEQDLPFAYLTFAKIIKERLAVAGFSLKDKPQETSPGVPDNLIKSAYIFGKIYKKSQVLGKWQERFVVINRDGLFSYKGFNEKYSIHIQDKTIRELWTRFDLQQEMLVIKMIYQSTKTEFGIPLVEVMNSKNWLFFFFNMMGKGK